VVLGRLLVSCDPVGAGGTPLSEATERPELRSQLRTSSE
jgi:hypothetical protein